jgi:hypothetical protein
MFVLNADITISGKRFTRVAEVEIQSSKVLEDTARIVLPTTALLERQGAVVSEVETAKQFAVGDLVVINLGYNGTLREEFRGYVSKIKPTTPVEIECVDAVWLLRRKNLSKSFRTTTLKALLAFIVDGTGITLKGEIPGIDFKKFYLRNVTAAHALQKLKDEYGLTLFLKNFNELHVGLTSYTDNVHVRYSLGQNVIDNSLEWVNEDDTRIRIKAVHVRPNNTKIEKEYGDADGELRTLYFYDIDAGESLEKLAKQEALKYKYAGFKGSLNTFLLPNVQVGNVAVMSDPDYSERAGSYLIDKVVTTFGTNGARRAVSLGLKVTV